MTWEWSHTNEAYAYAESQVRAQRREWLEVVFAEWRANQSNRGRQDYVCGERFDNRRYERALAFAKNPEVAEEQLADFIWERMSEQAHCTNGGHQAHACPFGCVPHLVDFGPASEPDEV